MFTGSAPYVEMFRGTLRPGFIYNLMLSLGAALVPGKKTVQPNKKVA